MLSISSEYELSLNENSNQLIKAKITFADNTVRQLTGDDIVACDFDQQVSSDSSFDIGTAIIGQMNITLNNHDGRFDACDFTKAQFVVWVGKELSSGTEWIQRGVYTANQPDAYNGTIAISALDRLSSFEVPFSDFVKAIGLQLSDSVQIRQVIDHMCHYCGVKWDDDGNSTLNSSFCFAYVDQSATCRQVLAYCCQTCCVNASVTPFGNLRTVWYDSTPFEAESDLDGGEFDAASPYGTGASKDGGNFTDYSSGDAADGGTFFTNRGVHRLYAFSNITVNTDDVVITGVRVSERSITENSETISGETVLAGEEGYVLSIANNPLILPGFGRDVADAIATNVIGMRFRPFSGKHICVPSIETGDCAYVIDRKQNVYKTYVTRVKYSVNGGMTVSCGAKSASRNSADNAGASTSAYVKARNEIQRELSARDLAIKALGESLSNASGLYHTEVKQSDGSIVYYLHDKPTTGQSQIIYKVTASGIGISTDAGKTYATGLSADGNAVLNRIYAIGINADYLTTGRISSKNGNSFIDLDTEEANLKLGNKSTVGGKVIATTDAAIKSVTVEYAQNGSRDTPPTAGWSIDAPAWSAGRYIWSRTKTVMQSGDVLITDPVCLSGADGANGVDGRGIKSSVPEYYLSTSASSATGGSWSTSVPDWSSGRYYWQRLRITWSDGSTSYSTPAYNAAMTSANKKAQSAMDTVNGLDQKKIFNLLTDNGRIKGLYTKDGQLFVNADYIGTGRIAANNGENYIDLNTGEAVLKLGSASTVGGNSIPTEFDALHMADKSSVERIAQIVASRKSSDDARLARLGNKVGNYMAVIYQYYDAAYTGDSCTYKLLTNTIAAVSAATDKADLEKKLASFGTAYDNHTKALNDIDSVLIGGESIETQHTVDRSLTQQSVFNKLTNNGQEQGIYLQNGKVYLNGEYIKADTVSVNKLTTSNGSMILSSTSNGGQLKYGSFSSAILFGKNSIGFNVANDSYMGMLYAEPDSFMYSSVNGSGAVPPMQVSISLNSALIRTGGGSLEIKNNHLYFNDRQIA